ncbi:hypothetical protein PQR64_26570 [Paraburkholderia phytofirmans]|uniref:phage protein n=1 Tax=Paraburkholderia phytofirmans TaxID=261302 RepID=UPI0038B8097D
MANNQFGFQVPADQLGTVTKGGMQFGRKLSFRVTDNNGNGLDLSNFRVTFKVEQSDIETPNLLIVTIYNLSDDTSNRIGGEFTNVSLSAGYEGGSYGQIFMGNIKWIERGKEKNTDKYLRIWAGDGDQAYNFTMCNQALAAGTDAKSVMDYLTGKFAEQGIGKAADFDHFVGVIPPQALSRGKVMQGMARDHMRDWSTKNGFKWSTQNGNLVLVPITGYRPGEAVVLSSTTGLIGTPKADQGGVKCRCLLNPNIVIGGLIQLAHDDINTLTTNQLGLSINSIAISASTTWTGLYRVLVSEHEGDSRGHEWYTEITALAIDPTAPPAKSAFGFKA